MKKTKIQKPPTRAPRQERARQKVELILEAAIRLLEKGGLPLLTTNAAAETAGVSIGTLYQYFPNKEAILDALADRESAALSERVMIALQHPSAGSPHERIGHIVRAVTSSYGERPRAHRAVMGYSLSHGGQRIAPLIERITGLLTSRDRDDTASLREAEAFVLANAVAGVLRAMILRSDAAKPAQVEIEDILGRLIAGFIESRRES